MIKGYCEYCGKEMTAPNKSRLHRFCSHECSNRWKWENTRKRAETITIPCAYCGKPVVREIHDWRFKKGVKLVFCSNDCHTAYSRAHRKPNTCEWCGKEFMHKYHNTKYCCDDCKHMSQRYKMYKRLYDQTMTKEEFIALYESNNPFVYAGREAEYFKEYNTINKDKISEKRKQRLENNPVVAYGLKIKKQIQAVYARKQKSVGPKLFAILGCQANEFIEHINSQLRDGMTIENYGEWELDHIVPISSAKSVEDVDRLCHFSNYQPLWRKDNHKKGGAR